MENDTKELRKLRTDVRGRTIQALDSMYESVREGDEFTTFTEFCRRLGVEPKTGNSKRAQIEQFTRYFEWEKDGNKIIITKVYDEPLPDLTDGIYSGLIKQLILDMLSSRYLLRNEKHLVLSFAELIREIEAVNTEYATYKNDSERLADELGITLDYVVDFYNVTDSKLYGSVTSALNSLQNKSLVDYQIVKMLRVVHPEDSRKKIVRMATAPEREKIVHFERLVLDDMGCKSKTDVVLRRKWEEFSDKMGEYFTKNGMEYIDFYYNAFDIVFNQFVVDEGERVRSFLLSNRHEIKSLLNNKVVDAHKKSYSDRHEKAIEMLSLIESEEVENVYGFKRDRLMLRADYEYVDTGELLIDKTIRTK